MCLCMYCVLFLEVAKVRRFCLRSQSDLEGILLVSGFNKVYVVEVLDHYSTLYV